MTSTKFYDTHSLKDHPDLLSNTLGDIPEEMLEKLSKDLGFSYDLYAMLESINQKAAQDLVKSKCQQSNHPEISILKCDTGEDGSPSILGYSLDSPRHPVLNSEFSKRVMSLIESCAEVVPDDIYFTTLDTFSSVILKKVKPIKIEIGHPDRASDFFDYEIGILLVNEELGNAYSRLVVYIDHQPIYLPPSYYNKSTSRYIRSTSNSTEALEVLTLSIIDDLREDELTNRIMDFHMKYRVNREIAASYEEYTALSRAMLQIPSIIDDRGLADRLTQKYADFEDKYSNLDDRKSSYIWRCTALGDVTIGALVHVTAEILTELAAPSIEYYRIRDLLGSYLCTHRIAAEIAKEG